MFVGWMIQTAPFLSLVNGILLVTGIVAILIVAILILMGIRHPASLGTSLVVGVIALVVRFTHLVDWTVNAVWMWLFFGGLAVAFVGGVSGVVTHRRVFIRTGVATVRMAGICVSALKRSAASGELTRVTVGVLATILTVIAVMVAVTALVVALRGW